MAFTLSLDGVSNGLGSVTFNGSWNGADLEDCSPPVLVRFEWGPSDGGFFFETPLQSFFGSSGSYSAGESVSKDTALKVRAKGSDCSSGQKTSTSQHFKTNADEPSASAPIISSITSSGAQADATFNAAVVNSSFSVVVEYRQFGTTEWVVAGTPVTSGSSISRALSGLLGATTYEVRVRGSRDTANTQSWVSGSTFFTTLADAPTITTVAASVVTQATARLNGSVDPNTLGVRVRFGWGTSDGGSSIGGWTNATAEQDFSGDGEQGFEASISGLSASTAYFFRAFVTYPSPGYGSTLSGSTLSFTTAADPLAAAAQEDHVLIQLQDAPYGVAHDVYFSLPSPATTSSDRFVTTAPGTLFATGDIKLSKDGAAQADYTVANIVQVAASQPLYKMPLSATDLQAEQLLIVFKDQDGPAFRDLLIVVRTKMRIGQVHVNASAIGGSAAAVIFQPSSGGYSLDLTDSAATNIGKMRGFIEGLSLRSNTAQAGGASTCTLDSGASATNDYYNGDVLMLIGGTGSGQARVITDYDGTTKVATVNAAWSTNPDVTTRFVIIPGDRTLDLTITELTGVPSTTDTASKKLQFCFQRFAFKIDQTAVVQTMYKADSSTTLATRSVSDDGTTQTIAKAT